ncbi:hypothetical protein [Streptomyces sp. SID13031]|uniref:hypothetical protein n=1 Tax=Streptomyces sp. SID13031 TaxID=2706046 RepID=UPI0013C7C0C0|nr:hypothetical protein [Streptomyces sp. SID13031]NEA33914.1 hypothetical protein [Streptomyces sp. SID13031]
MVTELPTNEVVVDLDDGGRWTSLVLGGREWLWAGPGLISGSREELSTYVDVGGLDECFPTVRGVPDHGGLWNQPWGSLDEDEDWDAVQYGDAVLLRRFNGGEPPAELDETGAIWVDYRLVAPAGYRFVWAAHALLDCSAGSKLDIPAGTESRLYLNSTRAASLATAEPHRAAKEPRSWVAGQWPAPGGVDLSVYGPTDGSAVGAVLIDCPTTSVVDGPLALDFSLSCPGQPVSTALWRNLGGFPAEAPYRSLGVEPMLGRVFGLAEAGPGDAAVVPESGELTWRLVVSARSV